MLLALSLSLLGRPSEESNAVVLGPRIAVLIERRHTPGRVPLPSPPLSPAILSKQAALNELSGLMFSLGKEPVRPVWEGVVSPTHCQTPRINSMIALNASLTANAVTVPQKTNRGKKKNPYTETNSRPFVKPASAVTSPTSFGGSPERPMLRDRRRGFAAQRPLDDFRQG